MSVIGEARAKVERLQKELSQANAELTRESVEYVGEHVVVILDEEKGERIYIRSSEPHQPLRSFPVPIAMAVALGRALLALAARAVDDKCSVHPERSATRMIGAPACEECFEKHRAGVDE